MDRQRSPVVPFVPVEGELLRHLLFRRRRELGLLQREVANAVPMHRQPYGGLERQNRVPRPGTLRGLAVALDVPEVYVCRAANVTLMAFGQARGLREREPAKCGTISGRKRHRAEGTEQCDACRQASNDYSRMWHERDRRAKGFGPAPAAKCGTNSGAQKHNRDKTPMCDECRAAQREYNQRLPKRPSPFTGVYAQPSATTWFFRIKSAGITKCGFVTAEAAYEARQKKLKEIGR